MILLGALLISTVAFPPISISISGISMRPDLDASQPAGGCFPGFLLLAFLGTASQAENQVESALLLDVVVGKGTTIFKLLASEDQTLLIGGNALLVLSWTSKFKVNFMLTRLEIQAKSNPSEPGSSA